MGKLSLGAGTIRILEQITDAKYVGEESKGGVKCYHITGKVAAADGQGHRRSRGHHRHLPDRYLDRGRRQLRLRGRHPRARLPPTSLTGTWRSIVLSNLDVYVDIKAPI